MTRIRASWNSGSVEANFALYAEGDARLLATVGAGASIREKRV